MGNSDNYNTEVKQWGTTILKDVKQEAADEGIIHRKNSKSEGSSVNKLRISYLSIAGQIKRISIKVRQTLIYVHKGVGNETPIAKAGTTNRKAKPFLNDPIDKKLEELADIVAEHTGDNISNDILIQ